MGIFRKFGLISDGIINELFLFIFTTALSSALILYAVHYFPYYFPKVKIAHELDDWFEILFICTFVFGGIMNILKHTSFHTGEKEDYIMVCWLLAVMGMVLWILSDLVIAAKIYYTGNPKCEYWFEGKTNLVKIMNVGLFLLNTAAFLGIPVILGLYIKAKQCQAKFYAIMLGIFTSYFILHYTKYYNMLIKWLNS